MEPSAGSAMRACARPSEDLLGLKDAPIGTQFDSQKMNFKSFVIGAGLAMCCFDAIPAYCGSDAPSPSPAAAVGVLSGQKIAQKLAKITPGVSTKAQVRSLLGAPWRTVQYNDLDQLEDEIWEYRGVDATGTFRVHIEFDHHDVVHILAKIPDNASGSQGTPAKSAPNKAPQPP
jgi:hypothetical protein